MSEIEADWIQDERGPNNLFYLRWRDGICPCCGGDLVPAVIEGTTYEPKAIGEGVQMCGMCVQMGHTEKLYPAHLDDKRKYAEVLLEVILEGSTGG